MTAYFFQKLEGSQMKRRELLIGMSALVGSNLFMTTGAQANRGKLSSQPEPWADKLIAAAESQIGITTIYDPAYVGLSFPGGDIPRQRGVCTDVVIRAYRDAFDYDLQAEVNKDMRAYFNAYPKIWGLKRTDRNIDHRRVPNLQTFFKRQGAALPISDHPGDYLPGDIVSQMLPGNLPHMAIVTHRPSPDGNRLMLVHNIGAGTRLEDRLFDFEITGHFRFEPSA
jgi:uncharacterized protein